MKFCKDCKWLREPTDRPTCGHPSSMWGGDVDLVTGKQKPARPMACEDARWLDFRGLCGPSGKHWEAADSTPVGFT